MTKNPFLTALRLASLLATVPFALGAQSAHAGATIPVGSGFNKPYGVGVDGSGNVFVADSSNGQVKEIVAANGQVSATSAVNIVGSGFVTPYGVAADSHGNVFVADPGVPQVYEIIAVNDVVSATSQVNVVGSGIGAPFGVAVDSHGNVFVTDDQAGHVDEIVAVNGLVSSSSTVNVITSAFASPEGVALDSYGNVFFANASPISLVNVYQIAAVNGVVSASSTVNPIGSGFKKPYGVALDGYGNVFVTDSGQVLEIVATSGAVSTASTVQSIGAGYNAPEGLAVDANGNVFVANAGASQILETLSGTQKFPTTAVGATSAPLTIYFTIDTAGTLAASPYIVLTQGAQNLDFQAAATQPSNVCSGGHAYNPGDICAVNVTFTSTQPSQRIGAVQLMGAAGTPIASYNLHGIGTGARVIFASNSNVSTISSPVRPTSAAVDGKGDVFVIDTYHNTVNMIAASNGVVSSTSPVTSVGSGFNNPIGVAVDGSGDVFVADGNGVEEIVALNGLVSSTSTVVNVRSGFGPAAVAVDGNGNVFAADAGNNQVKEIVAVNGTVSAHSVLNVVGSGFTAPDAVAVDAAGNVFVASQNGVEEIVAVNGVVTANSTVTSVGSGFASPQGLAVDGSGNVYVADFYNSALKEIVAVNGIVSPTSTVVTLIQGHPGGGLAPYGVALDAKGNVFIADNSNNAVDELDRADPPSFSFAPTNINSGASSDSPQSVTIQNIGNATLTAVSPGIVIGANFIQVPGAGAPADCSATFSLTPGQECNLSISFIPQSIGPLTASAAFIDNALNANPSATQVIQLSGTGQGDPQTITFNNPGTQYAGVPLTIVGASTTSLLPLSYSASGACTNTGAVVTFTVLGGQCAITVSQAGNSIFASASVTQNVTVQSAVSPSTSNNGALPSTNIGSTSSPLTVTFTFDESQTLAASPLVVLTQGALNLDFQAAPTAPANVCLGGHTYNPGDTCTVNITFTPTKPGLRLGAVQLMGASSFPVATFNLHGTGVGPQVAFPGNSTLTTLFADSGNTATASVAVDGSGDVFVGDLSNGVLEFAAVNGAVPPNPVGFHVGNQIFYQPWGVAVDGSGNIFVADSNFDGNYTYVYEIVAVNGAVSASSNVIPLPPISSSRIRGVAVDGSGNVFVADVDNGVVDEIVAVNGVVSAASNLIVFSGFFYPFGVALDSAGNVFVTDPGGKRNNQRAGAAVYEIQAVNGAVSTASNVITVGSGFNSPIGVALDAAGNVYVADGSQLKEIIAVNGAVSAASSVITVSGGFAQPLGIALDGSGHLFVADGQNDAVYEINRATPPSLTFANTNVNAASSDSPQAVTIQNNGNATLTALSPGLAISTNFTQVPGSGSPADCTASFSLSPGQECNLSISFTPQSGGPLAGTATFTDNALNANPSATQVIQLAGTGLYLTQTITFNTILDQTVGTPLILTATASSSLPVSYQSTTQTVCTTNSSTISFLAPGPCSLTASQNGNTTYSSATPVTQQFTVNPNIAAISNIQAVSVGGNSEVITWNTSQPSTTQVNYGATSNYGSSSPLDSNLVSFHSVTLTGLSANITYNFDVTSTNSTSGTVTSQNSTFATTPYVGYVAFWGVNNSGVTISWSTDFAATTFVAYGTTSALGQTTPVQTTLSNSHGVVLTSLNPGTAYYFRAGSTDASGHTGASTLYSFTTTGAPASPAPVISSVTVSNITTTGATITWTTDQAATTQVNYGATTAYGSSSPLNSSLLTSHTVTLTGLTPGTTYDYDVVSTNSSGTSSGMSTNYTFATTAIIGTPPVIGNIQSAVTSTTATITWTTDQASNSSVNYGTGTTTPDSNYVTSHSVTLTSLTPGTLYNFSVVSTNAGGLTTTSPNSTFTTTAANATPPYVGYVASWGINNAGVTISWSTDLPANTQLNYGTSPSLGTLTPVQATLTNSHGIVLTGLASGTTYYFVAQSTAANGATGYSTSYSFTTTGSPSAPAPNISNIQTTATANSATITWTTDEAASSQVNYGVTATYSASSTLDPTLKTSHSVTLTNLMPGTTYNFNIVSSNVNSLSATSTNQTFQTSGSAPGPNISGVSASSITSSSALITWTTDQAATSVVNYGSSQTVTVPALVTSHSVTLTGLTPNTPYTFTVTSVNAASVSTTSSTYTFTTSTQSAAQPVISYVAFWGVTSSGVTISWSTNVPSNTAVNYGTTNALGTTTPVQTSLTNSHGVVLTGLQPDKAYYFQAQSADVNGNTGYSPTIYTFTTLGASGPAIVGTPTVTANTNNTASISWNTSTPTYSYVQYGPDAGNYNRYSAQTALTTSPNCTLSYVPSGAVHYQLVSTDAYGNQVVSPDATFGEP